MRLTIKFHNHHHSSNNGSEIENIKNRLKSSSQSCSIELNYVSYFKYVVWKNTYVTRIVNTLQSYESFFGL